MSTRLHLPACAPPCRCLSVCGAVTSGTEITSPGRFCCALLPSSTGDSRSLADPVLMSLSVDTPWPRRVCFQPWNSSFTMLRIQTTNRCPPGTCSCSPLPATACRRIFGSDQTGSASNGSSAHGTTESRESMSLPALGRRVCQPGTGNPIRKESCGRRSKPAPDFSWGLPVSFGFAAPAARKRKPQAPNRCALSLAVQRLRSTWC